MRLYHVVGLVGALMGSQVRAEPDIPIDPNLETEFDWEGEVTTQMIDRLTTSINKSYEKPSTAQDALTGHSNQMLRDAHPKGTGCVAAKLKVLDRATIQRTFLSRVQGLKIPSDFFQGGILQDPRGAEYNAVVRFSSSAPSVKPDTARDARGMAIKIFGVTGEKWPLPPPPNKGSSKNNQFGSDSYTGTQDFVMIDHPTFPIKDARAFNDLVAIALGLPGAIPKFLMPSSSPKEWRFDQLVSLLKFNGKKPAHLFGLRFHSITPYAWFGYPIKFSVTPHFPYTAVSSTEKNPNILRQMADETLQKQDIEFDFSIQIRDKNEPLVDIKKVVENASTLWSEANADYPSVKIATLTIPKQKFDDPKKLLDCDNLSFNIWNSLKVYRPLGSINRSRRAIYKAISDHRHTFNGQNQ